MSASTVTFTAPCDVCGHPAVWRGVLAADPGGGTTYTSIDCVACDGWTVAAQLARRNRVEPAPLPAQLPVVPELIRRNALWRMLQRALDRRAA